MHRLVLSAFRQKASNTSGTRPSRRVSMHRLVLSAFRHYRHDPAVNEYAESQCTVWCSVLSDLLSLTSRSSSFPFQCTFWCSVLSD